MKRLLPFRQVSIMFIDMSKDLVYYYEYIMAAQSLGRTINDFTGDNFDYSGLNFI
ncbi:hypothetical protein [Sporosarcina ureae]|uniref:hypothetical protein n=1 Tax=Sporosarcina ureae TaxID=1571 RepID=UPI0028AA6B0E|nr:hypothetical protein [Sporosarcina ureae]